MTNHIFFQWNNRQQLTEFSIKVSAFNSSTIFQTILLHLNWLGEFIIIRTSIIVNMISLFLRGNFLYKNSMIHIIFLRYLIYLHKINLNIFMAKHTRHVLTAKFLHGHVFEIESYLASFIYAFYSVSDVFFLSISKHLNEAWSMVWLFDWL